MSVKPAEASDPLHRHPDPTALAYIANAGLMAYLTLVCLSFLLLLRHRPGRKNR